LRAASLRRDPQIVILFKCLFKSKDYVDSINGVMTE